MTTKQAGDILGLGNNHNPWGIAGARSAAIYVHTYTMANLRYPAKNENILAG